MLINILLIIHVVVVIVMVGVILLQKSSSDGFISNQNPASLFSGSGKANFLTKFTTLLATIFIIMSLVLAWLSTGDHGISKKGSILDSIEGQKIEAPKQVEPAATPVAPTAPVAPSVPLAD
jgi:preprotein translocase subunit SecG